MSRETSESCLQDRELLLAIVSTWKHHQVNDQVNSTPTLFIDGERHGNLPYSELKPILDDALGR